MKTGVIINTYNEIEWIGTAIQSVIDYFDEVVVTEGAYQMAINVGATPRSTDGTLDILEKYKSEKNVTVIHENEFEQSNQLNKGLQVLKDKKVDWMLMVDADEIWEPKSIKVLKNYINIGEKNGIYQYWVGFYNFVNSFDQYANARMRRVFKITPQCRFIFRNENMEWPDHGKPVDTEIPSDYISDLPAIIKVFHYSGIKTGKRWKLKQDYLIKRNGHPRFSKWKIDKDGIQREEELLKKFVGSHPKIVREGGLYKLWEKDPSLLKQKLFGDQ